MPIPPQVVLMGVQALQSLASDFGQKQKLKEMKGQASTPGAPEMGVLAQQAATTASDLQDLQTSLRNKAEDDTMEDALDA